MKTACMSLAYLFFIFHYALPECKAFLASEFAFQPFNLMYLYYVLYFCYNIFSFP
jgi:hypothetical protein